MALLRVITCVAIATLVSCGGKVVDVGSDYVEPTVDAGPDYDTTVEPAQELSNDGMPCDFGEQCASGYCIPSHNSYGSGVCFSLEIDGCVEVTAPSPFHEQCASFTKRLYVCGDSYDVALLGTCTDIGTGGVGEVYHCCQKPGIP